MDTESPASCKRPRIVFLLPALSAGGAERVLITLMNGLDSNRFDRIFVAINEEGSLRTLIDSDIPFYSLGKGTRVGRSLPRLYCTLKELQPNVVISTMAHMNFAVLLLKPFFRKTRFIVREAITPTYFDQKPIIGRAAIKFAYKILYPCADLVISPAQKIIDEFRDILKIDVKNHCLLENPVDTDRILANRAGGMPIQRGQRDIVQYVCAGRLDHQKGFDRLIENLPALSQSHDWHLTILGAGDQYEVLQKTIEKTGLSDKVTLAGFKEFPWLTIAAADAFLMPSRYEGLPNVVLEALACGTPVIATRTSGGIEEIAANVVAGSLTLVDNMKEFIEVMAEIVPQSDESPRISLLPDYYKKERILERFTDLLAK